MAASETNRAIDAESLALDALVWTLSDPPRASRLLDLTGLDPAELRTRASDPVLLAATIGFLESHEPDLIACAESLGVEPQALVTARIALERA